MSLSRSRTSSAVPSASKPRRLASTTLRTPCSATRCLLRRAPKPPVPPVISTERDGFHRKSLAVSPLSPRISAEAASPAKAVLRELLSTRPSLGTRTSPSLMAICGSSRVVLADSAAPNTRHEFGSSIEIHKHQPAGILRLCRAHQAPHPSVGHSAYVVADARR